MIIIAAIIGIFVGFASAWFIATRKIPQLIANIARLEAQKEAQDKTIARQKEDRKEDEIRFENLANKIFAQNAKTFKTDSQQNIANLLEPVKTDIERFNKKVEDAFGKQAKEQFSLKEEIQKITQTNKALGQQADNLTSALKGDSKTQGDWGEVILQNILEDSGLSEPRDYVTQGKDLKLKDKSGRHQKPDVIINLPDEKHIVIDSKVTLKNYEEYCTDNKNEGALKGFMASIKSHINDLSATGYQSLQGLGTPDFVMMFIPIEGAYALAVQTDARIFNYAWSKKIVLVCPSTLFAMLLTIKSIWRLEDQNKNTAEIARVGGILYDKIAGFVDSMTTLGKQMVTAQETYDKALIKLSKGKGNALSTANRLEKLGIDNSKKIPKISTESITNTE